MDRQARQLEAFAAELADALRRLREQRQISQSALAAELGHDQAMVSRLESGRRRVSVEDLFLWADALGMKAADVALVAVSAWELTAERPPSLWPGRDD